MMTKLSLRLFPTLGLISILCGTFACTSVSVATFDTPEQAMDAIGGAMKSNDTWRIEQLLGADGAELCYSDDDAADRADAFRLNLDIHYALTFEDRGSAKVALIGKDKWPFPIPLTAEQGRWRFDSVAGREELEDRRIGTNEILTVATLHECVNAQREYLSQGYDGNPPCFAARISSTVGKHDGLYWPTAEGEAESPLGPLVASAAHEGIREGSTSPAPFHGYYYRTLSCQAKCAPGGQKTYLDEDGLMTRGFALLAWPAKYGDSGIMTFLVSQRGIVYENDLGPDTERAAMSITEFAPDPTWSPTGD